MWHEFKHRLLAKNPRLAEDDTRLTISCREFVAQMEIAYRAGARDGATTADPYLPDFLRGLFSKPRA